MHHEHMKRDIKAEVLPDPKQPRISLLALLSEGNQRG